MIALFIDADNFNSPVWVNEAIEKIERDEGPVAIRRAYGSAEALKGLSEALRLRVISPFANIPLSKSTTDLSLALDVMQLACQTQKPRIVVIASGDLDFVPLAVRLREMGIRVLCVSGPTKMGQEALPAYDHVIYVGINHVPTSAKAVAGSQSDKDAPKLGSHESTSRKVSVANTTEKKSAASKKVANESAKADVTPKTICAALPILRDGQWQPLSQIAKILHDKKLLAKNATSTKLFRRHPEHFELTPKVKPNKVRLIRQQDVSSN